MRVWLQTIGRVTGSVAVLLILMAVGARLMDGGQFLGFVAWNDIEFLLCTRR